jgi:hypothetical protein
LTPPAALAEEQTRLSAGANGFAKSEIVREIRAGVRDMNQLKALVRAGLGGCNGKTCTEMILRIYREEGFPFPRL